MQFEIGAQPQPGQYGQAPYGQTNTKQKILIIVIIVAGVLALLFGMLWFFNRGDGNGDSLNTIVVANTEMIRKVENAREFARSTAGANFIADAQALLTSDNFELAGYLAGEYGKEPSEEEIEMAVNTEHDEDLSSAATTNNFDKEFLEIMKEDLEANVERLEELKAKVKDEALLELLDRAIANQTALLNRSF